MELYLDTGVLAAYYAPEPASAEAESLVRATPRPAISDLSEVELFAAVTRKVRRAELALADARRIRAEAESEAARHLEEARRQVQAFADARVRRITEISDSLIAAAEAIPARLEQAADVRRQIDELIVALGAAAEQAAREAARPAIRLPGIPEPAPTEEDA